MPRPTDSTYCHISKAVENLLVETPEGQVSANRGDYIVTDQDGQMWVFTPAQLVDLKRPPAKPLPPGIERPTNPDGF